LKNLAKSLHTVTVLAAIGRTYSERFPTASPRQAVRFALADLGLADAPDAYGLAEKAAAILVRENSPVTAIMAANIRASLKGAA
jgi:hypothetical protein